MTALAVESRGVEEDAVVVPRQCPRCAYDLAGTITSWHEHCPLRGTCSECGLEFAWRDIFDDRLSGPPWSFEHGAKWSWRRLGRTAWNAGLGRMWREIRLEIPIVSGRLVVLPLLVLLVFHVCASLVAMADALSATSNIAYLGIEWVLLNEALPALLWPYGREGMWFHGLMPVIVLAWVGMQWLFMPLLMLIMGETMRRVRVRRVHILRGACYSVMAAVCGTLMAVAAGGVIFLGPGAVFRTMTVGGTPPWIVIALIPAAWLAIWWYRFIKLYLRLPRAGVVTVVLMGVTVFAAFTFMFAGAMFLLQ